MTSSYTDQYTDEHGERSRTITEMVNVRENINPYWNEWQAAVEGEVIWNSNITREVRVELLVSVEEDLEGMLDSVRALLRDLRREDPFVGQTGGQR